MEKIIAKILQRMNGKLRFQPFFKKMQLYALEGQNYFNAVDVNRTGEVNVISKVSESFDSSSKCIFFDVGANQGQYTDLFLQKFANRDVDLHLFEPQEKMFNKLVEKYSRSNNVFLNHVAVSNIAQKGQTLFVCSKQPLIASVVDLPIQEFAKHLSFDEKENIDVIQLGTYCTEKNIDHIDLLKLDVEGVEYQCLQSLTSMIEADKISFIQFEYCFLNMVQKNYFYDFWQLLHSKYDLFRVLKDGLYKLDSYEIIYEQMAPINYLAVLKIK